MTATRGPQGRRERGKQDTLDRITAAARRLFADRGVGAVTTQQVADGADVAVGTLYLYAATKAELLIMVENEAFAAAVDQGRAAAAEAAGRGAVEEVTALVEPVVRCVRAQVENGRTYLVELAFGDPAEPHRRQGLAHAADLEAAIAETLGHDDRTPPAAAATLARVVAAVLHLATTATVHDHLTPDAVLADVRRQVEAVLAPRPSRPRPPGRSTPLG